MSPVDKHRNKLFFSASATRTSSSTRPIYTPLSCNCNQSIHHFIPSHCSYLQGPCLMVILLSGYILPPKQQVEPLVVFSDIIVSGASSVIFRNWMHLITQLVVPPHCVISKRGKLMINPEVVYFRKIPFYNLLTPSISYSLPHHFPALTHHLYPRPPPPPKKKKFDLSCHAK